MRVALAAEQQLQTVRMEVMALLEELQLLALCFQYTVVAVDAYGLGLAQFNNKQMSVADVRRLIGDAASPSR